MMLKDGRAPAWLYLELLLSEAEVGALDQFG
jgi:hypothetical protein